MNYEACRLCPRQCAVDRTAGQRGFCGCPDVALVAKTMIHRWEEPVLAGEGGSGGALALAAGDRIIMLENSIFSILSPEGFASILWKDSSRWEEAAETMKLTASDLKELGVCDVIVPEPAGGVTLETPKVFGKVREELIKALTELSGISPEKLVEKRYRRLRMIDRAAKRPSEEKKDM